MNTNKISYYYPEIHESHSTPNHPERPERVEAIQHALQETGWWEPFEKLPAVELPEDVFNAVHTPAYTRRLQQACQAGKWYDMDTYLTGDSWDVAHNTAGGAAAVARSVWEGEYQSGFALCRPPGHHATQDRAMGFCLLNNIALAAEYLRQKSAVERIAIIDLDLHHGNGTQDIFWKREDVFYFSTHQSPLYPGSGHVDDIGVGDGKGATANFPLPPGSGERAFTTVVNELILPLLDRFKPDVLLVSAGFDTHWRDPLGSLQLSAGGYGKQIRNLKHWANDNCGGKIILFLEGGYDLQALQACSQACVAALIDEPWQDWLGRPPYPETLGWEQMVKHAKSIWQV